MAQESVVVAEVFGDVLRNIRESEDFSQHDLAKKAELNRTFISFLERGLRQPSLTTVIALAKAFKMRTRDLVAEVEKRLFRRKSYAR